MARREKLSRAMERLEASEKKLAESLQEDFVKTYPHEVLIEIVTKRFEYTFESLWKCLRELLLLEGLECNSPLSCFKEAFSLGLIDKKHEDVFPLMVRKRNEIVHIYSDEDAEEIYFLIKDTFAATILEFSKRIRNRIQKS